MPLDLFSKTKPPKILPEAMLKVVGELKKSSGKEDCLRRAYEIMTKEYSGYRVRTYTRLFEVFKKEIGFLWNREGFLHCTNINYVLRTILIASGLFKEEDIKLRWTQIWLISPHQYMQVNVGEKWIDVDIWAASYGIDFGDHARGFH